MTFRRDLLTRNIAGLGNDPGNRLKRRRHRPKPHLTGGRALTPAPQRRKARPAGEAGQGRCPWTPPEGAALWTPAKGSGPWNPLVGCGEGGAKPPGGFQGRALTFLRPRVGLA